MSKKIVKIAVCVSVLTVLSVIQTGCRTDPTILYIEGNKGNIVGPPRTQMHRWVKILGVSDNKTKDGNVTDATVQLQAINEKTACFEYRFLWFDQDNHPITPSSGQQWRSVILRNGEIKDLKDMAPSADSANFRFEIRYIEDH